MEKKGESGEGGRGCEGGVSKLLQDRCWCVSTGDGQEAP